jgi:biotin synthase-related radical SAM superfamily protein
MMVKRSSKIGLKAELLSAGLIKVHPSTFARAKNENRKLAEVIIDIKNLYSWHWLFIRLGDKERVRLIIDPTQKCDLELTIADVDDSYNILDKNNFVIATVTLEDSLYHCPEQLFFNLYTWCSSNCEFCPIAGKTPRPRDTIQRMVSIAETSKHQGLHGVGITTGIPAHLSSDKLIDETARAVEKLRKVLGNSIPIGVSPFACSEAHLKRLHTAGAEELRINSETFNSELFSRLCPDKNLDLILQSLQSAVSVFGSNKVSSNLIVGLGENDEDIHKGINILCQLGVIPTLYPLDPIPEKFTNILKMTNGRAARPDSKRLLELAKYHSDAITKSKLEPLQLRTMCPACSASHLMPGIDMDSSITQ